MRLLKRDVITSRTVPEVIEILHSSACRSAKAVFEQSSFSMHCIKRVNLYRGVVVPIPVKGIILEGEEDTHICLEIHTTIAFYISCIFVLAGLIGSVYGFVSGSDNWFSNTVEIAIGLLVLGFECMRGTEVLDLLEHKLTRSID